ncbi:MAG: orotate phosphoribosyltransferase [Candidatus Bathyarchaeota archaeon]|nr:orotate phosphoribosyltransferase [Candidatus Bathyarchaeota archaeon]
MSMNIGRIAQSLYNANCLRFGSFRIKSGALSPYYIDLARLLSSPKDLCNIAQITSELINKIMSAERIDKIASIALKGALISPSIATIINLPCIIVRKKKKEYGAKGRIIGTEVNKGDNILFFDDVVSEGISKIEGIKPLEDQGGNVKHLIVVVDREQGGKEKLEQKGYLVHSLARISEIVKFLAETKKISDNQAISVLKYINKA